MRRKMVDQFRCHPDKRPRQNIGDDEVKRTVFAEGCGVETRRRLEGDAADNAVEARILTGNFRGDGVDVRGQDRHIAQLAHGNCQHAGTGAEIERIADAARLQHVLDDFKAAGRGSVMPGAEGLTRIDLDRQIIHPHLVAVMATMHDETPGPYRFKPFQRHGDPVGLGNDFLFDGEIRIGVGDRFDEARANVVFVGSHQVDRGFPYVFALIDLLRRQRDVLLAEGDGQKIEDVLGLALGGAHIQADFTHGSGLSR